MNQGQNLTMEESSYAVESMMHGSWEPGQTSTFLTMLQRKGETADELAGFAKSIRRAALQIPISGIVTMDTCGTGGDKKGSFNISTVAAFVLAGCGIPIVKHGNRAASSQCGSADLLNALGIRYRLHPEEAADAVASVGFAFLFAPDFHPATRSVAEIRKQLDTPTIFNLLGPLTNPANPKVQLIGVYKRNALSILAEAMRKSDPERRALLLHGEEGWDEATTCCNFMICDTSGEIKIQNARHFGFETCRDLQLRGGSPAENARIAIDILNGETGPRRDTVLLNALLGFRIYHSQASKQEAFQAVAKSLDSGAAWNIVTRFKEKFPGETS